MISTFLLKYWYILVILALIYVVGATIYSSIERSILGGIHEKNQTTINRSQDGADEFTRCPDGMWDYRRSVCRRR
jgi:hypothetical protein